MSEPRWRKASFSGPNDHCVELAILDDHTIGVRDSKDRGQGLVLRFHQSEIRAFIDRIRGGELDDLLSVSTV